MNLKVNEIQTSVGECLVTQSRMTSCAHGALNCPSDGSAHKPRRGHWYSEEVEGMKTPPTPTMRLSAERKTSSLWTIQTNLQQGETEEKEEVVTLTATIELRRRRRSSRRRRATRRCGTRVEFLIFDQNGAVLCLRKRRRQRGWTCSQPPRDFSLFFY